MYNGLSVSLTTSQDLRILKHVNPMNLVVDEDLEKYKGFEKFAGNRKAMYDSNLERWIENCRETKWKTHIYKNIHIIYIHTYISMSYHDRAFLDVSSLPWASKRELKNASFLQIQGIMDELEKLKATFAKKPHTSLAAEATYLCDTIKPQMVALRAAVDKAEGVMEASIYPYPTYEQMIYSHHFWGRFCHLSYFASLFWVDDIDVYPPFGTWKWIFPTLWGSADWGFDLWHLPPILPLLSVERCRKCPWKITLGCRPHFVSGADDGGVTAKDLHEFRIWWLGRQILSLSRFQNT